MTEIQHRFVETNGLRMHIAEAGRGPLVLLLHGFPELWYSWRHQLAALSDAGFHVVAPDQRGYGQTDRPEAIDAYSILDLVGDVVGLVGALGEQSAVVVGHDWGASVAWSTALFRPDLVRGVAILSVPYRPRRTGTTPPLTNLRAALGDGFYQLYFQQPGTAEADLSANVRRTMRLVLWGASGNNPVVPDMMVRPGQGFFGEITPPATLPDWLTEADIDEYTREFERTGFAGGLNWYRNIDRNWRLTAPWQDAKITPPALMVLGDRDLVYHFPGGKDAIANLRQHVPNLSRSILLEGCGHWTQQERPAEVNQALLEFLNVLP